MFRNIDRIVVGEPRLPLKTKDSPSAELNAASTLVSAHSSASLPSVPGGSWVVVFFPEPAPLLSSSLSDPSLAPYNACTRNQIRHFASFLVSYDVSYDYDHYTARGVATDT